MKTFHHYSPLSDRQATRKLINQARHASRKTDSRGVADTIWAVAIALIPMLGFLTIVFMEG